MPTPGCTTEEKRILEDLILEVGKLRRSEYLATQKAATDILVAKYATELSLIYQRIQKEVEYRLGKQ